MRVKTNYGGLLRVVKLRVDLLFGLALSLVDRRSVGSSLDVETIVER